MEGSKSRSLATLAHPFMMGNSAARQLLRFLCFLLCHSSLFRFLNRRQRRVSNGGIGELFFGHTFSSVHDGQ